MASRCPRTSPAEAMPICARTSSSVGRGAAIADMALSYLPHPEEDDGRDAGEHERAAAQLPRGQRLAEEERGGAHAEHRDQERPRRDHRGVVAGKEEAPRGEAE